MVYFTADTHFGHKAVINFCNRLFSSVEEMDKAMIDGWNSRVRDEDDIYIIGDIMYRCGKRPEVYLDRLKGKKHLIRGNHDYYWYNNLSDPSKYFISVTQIDHVVLDDGKRVVLCHYPILEWSGYNRGTYHIHGHIHNRVGTPQFKYIAQNDSILNAGVDVNGFVPVTLQELIYNNKAFKEAHSEQ